VVIKVNWLHLGLPLAFIVAGGSHVTIETNLLVLGGFFGNMN